MSSDRPTLVILAAGMGSRFGGNKQTAGMGPHGETIMEYSIYDAIQAGFGKVVFIVREFMKEMMEERFLAPLEGKIETELVFQELQNLPDGYRVPEGREKPWGTGHALLMAKKAVKGNFVVINADDFYAASAFQTIADHLQSVDPSTKNHCLVGFELAQTLSENGGVSRGICTTDSNRFLTTVEEHHKIQQQTDGAIRGLNSKDQQVELAPNTEVSMNFWGFTPAYFDDLEKGLVGFLNAEGQAMKSEYLIPNHVNDCMQAGDTKVKMLHSADRWYGVTYKEDQPVVEAYLNQIVKDGKYPSPLWS